MPLMSRALTLGFADSAHSGEPVDVKPGSKVHSPVDGCSFLMSTNLAPDASCQHLRIDGSHHLSLKAASQHHYTGSIICAKTAYHLPAATAVQLLFRLAG